jgi:hypothetical protein
MNQRVLLRRTLRRDERPVLCIDRSVCYHNHSLLSGHSGMKQFLAAKGLIKHGLCVVRGSHLYSV